MAVTKKRATYDDLAALPEHVVGEIIDGELFVTPRPAFRHGVASSVIGSDILGPFHGPPGGGPRGPGGWWIVDEPELHLGQEVLVPDTAGWRRERMPRAPTTAAVELAPDWVLEVLSPATAKLDRQWKMAVYARVAVRDLWLVDPVARTVETFRLGGESWLLAGVHGDDARVRLEPFAAIELELSRWWIESEPTP
jgi:Uma2 family endonuclease